MPRSVVVQCIACPAEPAAVTTNDGFEVAVPDRCTNPWETFVQRIIEGAQAKKIQWQGRRGRSEKITVDDIEALMPYSDGSPLKSMEDLYRLLDAQDDIVVNLKHPDSGTGGRAPVVVSPTSTVPKAVPVVSGRKEPENPRQDSAPSPPSPVAAKSRLLNPTTTTTRTTTTATSPQQTSPMAATQSSANVERRPSLDSTTKSAEQTALASRVHTGNSSVADGLVPSARETRPQTLTKDALESSALSHSGRREVLWHSGLHVQINCSLEDLLLVPGKLQRLANENNALIRLRGVPET